MNIDYFLKEKPKIKILENEIDKKMFGWVYLTTYLMQPEEVEENMQYITEVLMEQYGSLKKEYFTLVKSENIKIIKEEIPFYNLTILAYYNTFMHLDGIKQEMLKDEKNEKN